MPKQVAKAEIKSFIKGLITEASPLNFPPDASIDEENFNLNIDGSRNRRLGMDFESGYVIRDTGYTDAALSRVGINSFNWSAAGGNVDKNFVVVQFGKRIDIFRTDVSPISGVGYETSITLNSVYAGTKMSFAVVEGLLVIASNLDYLYVIEYNETTGFKSSTYRLLVRDQWGVYEGSSQNKNFRPVHPTENHIYNLRNQGWAIPRRCQASLTVNYNLTNKTTAESGEIIVDDFSDLGKQFNWVSSPGNAENNIRDPLEAFRRIKGKFPAISESVWTGMTFVAGSDPEELLVQKLYDESFGDTPEAAKGFFIIDAIKRGNGRLSALAAHYKRFPEIVWKIANLPEDYSTSGPSVITTFAGRVFYAGFAGEVVGGDKNSPNLSNCILFSQLIRGKDDLKKCYQEGDPTSREANDIVDTDGGFIKLEGAHKIIGMQSIGSVLIVIADNGVWLIKGGSDYGFTASNYLAEKLSSFGSKSKHSIVSTGDTVFFFGSTGIYVVSRNQYGDYVVDNISQQSIQKFYLDIDSNDREDAVGIFDEVTKQVRWMFNFDSDRGNSNSVYELIFDLKLKAFTRSRVYALTDNSPDIRGYVPLPQFITFREDSEIVRAGTTVVVDGVVVILDESRKQFTSQNLKYLVLTGYVGGNAGYTFAGYNNTQFKDWNTVDARAYMLTGEITGNDSGVMKQSPYLTMHFMRTEEGVVSVGGELIPAKQSGCLVRSQWEWSDTINSKKWSPQFQAYRYRKPIFITGPSDTFDNGFKTVVSKSKLRGRGRALSLYIETEPDKDCHVLGWNLQLTGNQL